MLKCPTVTTPHKQQSPTLAAGLALFYLLPALARPRACMSDRKDISATHPTGKLPYVPSRKNQAGMYALVPVQRACFTKYFDFAANLLVGQVLPQTGNRNEWRGELM